MKAWTSQFDPNPDIGEQTTIRRNSCFGTLKKTEAHSSEALDYFAESNKLQLEIPGTVGFE
jgi:hypothetical protein